MTNIMMLFQRMLLIGLAVVTLSVSPVSGQPGERATSQQASYLYVCNQGEATITVIESGTHEIVAKIDLQELGFSPNAKPHDAIAEPDGSYWYVTLIGENRVLKFDRNNELAGQVAMEVPGLMELHPTRDLLIVGRSMSAVNPPQSIGIISRSDMTLRKEVPTFFPRPHAIGVTPEGPWTYSASLAENQLLSLNLETEKPELTALEAPPHVFVDFAISPDGETMVVTGQVSGKLLFFDIRDPDTPHLTKSIDLDAQPWHPVYSPDGSRLYVGNKEAHTVTVVDMKSQSVAEVIEGTGLAQPHGSALSADGKYLYVTNNNRQGTYRPSGSTSDRNPPGTVTVINTETNTIEKIIEVGVYPTGIGTNAR